MTAIALIAQLDELATDVGRLRRRFASNDGWTGIYIAERIAERVQTLDAMLQPTAADLYRAHFALCGCHDTAVQEALATTERRAQELRRITGEVTR